MRAKQSTKLSVSVPISVGLILQYVWIRFREWLDAVPFFPLPSGQAAGWQQPQGWTPLRAFKTLLPLGPYISISRIPVTPLPCSYIVTIVLG